MLTYTTISDFPDPSLLHHKVSVVIAEEVSTSELESRSGGRNIGHVIEQPRLEDMGPESLRIASGKRDCMKLLVTKPS